MPHLCDLVLVRRARKLRNLFIRSTFRKFHLRARTLNARGPMQSLLPPPNHLLHIDLGSDEGVSLGHEPQDDHEANQTHGYDGYVAHIGSRDRDDYREAVDDVKEQDPGDSQSHDRGAVAAEREEPGREDVVAAAVEQDRLRDDAGGLEEDDASGDHGGKGSG